MKKKVLHSLDIIRGGSGKTKIYEIKLQCPECKSENIKDRSGYKVCFSCGKIL